MQPLSLQQLMDIARHRLDDAGPQPRMSDANLSAYLNEAESEASIRAKLLFEDDVDARTLLSFAANDHTIDIDSSAFDLGVVRIQNDDDTGDVLTQMLQEDLDAVPGWRNDTASLPRNYVVQLLKSDRLRFRLYPIPNADVDVRIEIYREPIGLMVLGTPSGNNRNYPEIGAKYHMPLVDWAIFRAHVVRDPDIENPNDPAIALARFESAFGIRETANQMRKKRTPSHPVIRARKF